VPPDREVCIGNQCPRTWLCYDHSTGEARCQQFDTCPISTLPKVSPDNREAIRYYELVKAGLIPPFNLDTTPARLLDRLAIVNGCVVRAENAMLRKIADKG